MKSDDRRVRRTKKAMTDALAELLSERPLNEISVREISEMADINRGTFYLHYRDVYDMVEKLQDEIFEKFNEIVTEHEKKDREGNLFPVLTDLLKLLAENEKLARVLLGKNGNAAFIERLKKVIREKCFRDMSNILKIKKKEDFDYFYNYVVMGCIGICEVWLSEEMKEPVEKIAAIAEALILKSVEAWQ